MLHWGVLLPFGYGSCQHSLGVHKGASSSKRMAKEPSATAAEWSRRSRTLFLGAHRVNAHSPCMPGLATVIWPAPAHPPCCWSGLRSRWIAANLAGYSWSLTWASVPKDALSAGSDGRFGVVTPAAGS